MTSTSLLAVSGASSKALWYLTRSTGLVALILLTATVVVGVVASVGWTTQRWPRFLSQHVHRNLSLFCVGFVAVHVITTVGDGYVPIGIADAFIPFRTGVPSPVGGVGGADLRPPAGGADHQRPPPPDRLRLVALRALAGLSVLAHRNAPRARERFGLRSPDRPLRGRGLRRRGPRDRGLATVHRPHLHPRGTGGRRRGHGGRRRGHS